MYTLYEWNGIYIMGKKVGSYKRLSTALKKARELGDFAQIQDDPEGYLILSTEGRPIGMIECENES